MKLRNARELDDLSNLRSISARFIPMMAPCSADVFPTGQVLMKAGRHFDQGPDASPQLAPPLGRAQDFGEELQHGRLASPVRTDDSERLAAPRLEGHVLERPELIPLQLVLGRARLA